MYICDIEPSLHLVYEMDIVAKVNAELKMFEFFGNYSAWMEFLYAGFHENRIFQT